MYIHSELNRYVHTSMYVCTNTPVQEVYPGTYMYVCTVYTCVYIFTNTPIQEVLRGTYMYLCT